MKKYENLVGKKFGRLTIVSQAENGKYGRRWNCICDCGTPTTKPEVDLKRTNRPTRSCGCLQKDKMKDVVSNKKTVALEKLTSFVNSLGGNVVGDYVDSVTNIDCVFDDITISSAQNSFMYQILPRMVSFKELLAENGDIFIKWTDFVNKKGAIAEIETFDGAEITMDCGNYLQFLEARKEFFDDIAKNGDTVLTPYTSTTDKILIKYGDCNHEAHWVKPISYKLNRSCPRCSGYSPKQAKEDFMDKLKVNGHILKSDYNGNFTKVLIDFRCGHKPHWIAPAHYKCGVGCPACSTSKGERVIIEYLLRNEIEFEHQKVLNNGRSYDIFIPKYNLVVEVHGRQHYYENSLFHRRRTFEDEQKNDRLKKEYALASGYNYMEIDYREHSPKLALERFLNQFKEYHKETV